MTQTTQDNRPLYKVLNDLRHRSEWHTDIVNMEDGEHLIIRNGIGNVVADFGDANESLNKVSARFAAIAVNNFNGNYIHNGQNQQNGSLLRCG